MAVKVFVVPMSTDEVLDVIAIAANTGAVTVKVALLVVTPLNEAVTVVLPCAKVEAMPLGFSVATVALLDAQVTDPEILPVLLSE